jgi:hypothetical protein
VKYRKLKGYKYQLLEDYSINIEICPTDRIDALFVSLSTEGNLLLRKGYACDGPSGPTWDTENFMRGSFVHDAIYQLMRENLISIDYRDYADRLLQSICLEDGMSRVRAWYVYWSVRYFAQYAANPKR